MSWSVCVPVTATTSVRVGNGFQVHRAFLPLLPYWATGHEDVQLCLADPSPPLPIRPNPRPSKWAKKPRLQLLIHDEVEVEGTESEVKDALDAFITGVLSRTRPEHYDPLFVSAKQAAAWRAHPDFGARILFPGEFKNSWAPRGPK